MRNRGVSRVSLLVNQKISHENPELLVHFLTSQGKIIPRNISGITLKQQRRIAKAIKRARSLYLLMVK